MRKYFALTFLAFTVTYASAQERPADTAYQKQDSVKIGNETRLKEDIRELSKEDHLLAKIVNALVAFDDEEEEAQQPSQSFDEFKDRPIKEIKIVKPNVFGPPDGGGSWLQRTGNALHIKTRDWIIRNQLLFREGDAVSKLSLSESERILRQKDYIYDASIVIEADESSDSVIAKVIVKDTWSITGDGNVNLPEESGFVEVTDFNFLGYGAALSGAYKRGLVYKNTSAWDASLMLDNLFNRHLLVNLYKTSDEMSSSYGFSAGRDFITPLFRWAGGVDINWSDRHNRTLLQDTFEVNPNRLHQQEYWFGYATGFRRHSQVGNVYYVAAGVKRSHFIERPENFTDYYQNNDLWLGSIGFARRKYHKTRYVSGLGKTEDIPSGSILALTFGHQEGEIRDKAYFGLKTGYSYFRPQFGYMSASLNSGAFHYAESLKESLVSLELLYFTPLMYLGNLHSRSFLWLKSAYFNQPRDYDLLFNVRRNDGIRGFPSRYVVGDKSLSLNYELNVYPPVRVVGFNFSIVAFADLLWLTPPYETLRNMEFYQGFGLGLRFRNELMVFPAVQLLLGYYPNGVAQNFKVFSQPRNFYRFNHFEFQKPSAVIE